MGVRPFYNRGELKYRDQGVNRTCKRGEAIRVSAPVSPSRASPAPPGPPPRGPAPGHQVVRTSLPGHPNSGSATGGPNPGQRGCLCAAAASTSAAIAAAYEASAAVANAMAGDRDTGMPAPSPGPGTGVQALCLQKCRPKLQYLPGASAVSNKAGSSLGCRTLLCKQHAQGFRPCVCATVYVKNAECHGCASSLI